MNCKCLICSSEMEYYFSKTYKEEPMATFMEDIGQVDYLKCKKCGFVLSKTHRELPFNRFLKLNSDYHHYAEKHRFDADWIGNPPPYIQHALMLSVLIKNKIINSNSMLDYASGYGTLSKALAKYFGHRAMLDYEPFASPIEICTTYNNLSKYKVVFNSAMFEHIIKMIWKI